MTKSKGQRAVEVQEEEVRRVRAYLFAAYLLSFLAIAFTVYTRGELAEWIE